MHIQRTSSATPGLILLSVVSVAVTVRSDFGLEELDNMLTRPSESDVEYQDVSPELGIIQKCREYPDLSLCSYWHPLLEAETGEDQEEPAQPQRKKRDVLEQNQTTHNPQENSTAGVILSVLEKREVLQAEPERPNEIMENLQAPRYYYDDLEPEMDKRYSGYRIRNPETEGYKRGPGFRSWGGKRAKFQSWGGKRDSSKGSRFSNWGGKRDGRGYKFNNWGGKRARFTSWGGKRDKGSKFSSWGGKRAKFASWGGKRDDYLITEPEKKSKFSSWGGKRAEEADKRDAEYPISYDHTQEDIKENIPYEMDLVKRPQFQSWGGKRGAFQSWGGKRSFPYSPRTPKLFIRRDDFRKFLNWGGKRKFSSWGGKRSYDDELDKRAFNSWGGKRDGKPKAKSNFQSWGGKRSPLNNPFNTSDETQFEPEEISDTSISQPEDEEAPIINSYVNKRAFLPEGQPMLRTAVLGDLLYPSNLAMGPRRRSEFFPWGGKREPDEVLR